MKQFIFSAFGVLVLALGFGLLVTPAKASDGVCAGDYSVTGTGQGISYNQAYGNMVANLQAQASNENYFCSTYGTCNETFTVTYSDHIEDLHVWIVQGREDFQCIFVIP